MAVASSRSLSMRPLGQDARPRYYLQLGQDAPATEFTGARCPSHDKMPQSPLVLYGFEQDFTSDLVDLLLTLSQIG